MTMTRAEKKQHRRTWRNCGEGRPDGSTVEFARPDLRAARIAAEGHAYMTWTEYKGYRMGRTATTADVRRDLAVARRAQRVTVAAGTTRRQTGRNTLPAFDAPTRNLTRRPGGR